MRPTLTIRSDKRNVGAYRWYAHSHIASSHYMMAMDRRLRRLMHPQRHSVVNGKVRPA